MSIPPLTQYGFATFSMRPTIPQAYTKSKRLCMYFCIFMHSLSFYNLYAYHFFPVLSSSGHADHNEIDPADSRCPQGSRARLDGTACCINVVHKDHAPDPLRDLPRRKGTGKVLKPLCRREILLRQCLLISHQHFRHHRNPQLLSDDPSQVSRFAQNVTELRAKRN